MIRLFSPGGEESFHSQRKHFHSTDVVISVRHWHPAHRVFKARALVYAERLVARPGQRTPADALETRAFVLALVGRHDLALADPDAATRTAKGASTPAESGASALTPPVRLLIDADMKADRSLLAIKNRAEDRLASLLAVMAVEYPPRTRLLIESARAVIKLDADCYRAYDAICQNGDLGDLHMATENGPLAFTELSPLLEQYRIGRPPACAGSGPDREQADE